ncbi:MAG: PKD domain-containing protein [Flavobacteriales bacterium]
MRKILLSLTIFTSIYIQAQKEFKLNFAEFVIATGDAKAADTFSTSEMIPAFSQMKIKANPATCGESNGEIVVFNPSEKEKLHLILSDLKGNILQRSDLQNGEFVFQSLAKGEYLLSTSNFEGIKSIDLVQVNDQQIMASGILMDKDNNYAVGQSISLSIEPEGVVSTVWHMGDGTVYTNQFEVNHTYKSGGKFAVSVEASNWDCEKTVVQEVMINQLVADTQDDY